MRVRSFFLVLFLMMTSVVFAQSLEQKNLKVEMAVNELIIEADSLAELQDFDWSTVTTMFQENAAEGEIRLVIAYSKKAPRRDAKLKLQEMKIEAAGPTKDLDKMIINLKESVEQLEELEGKLEEQKLEEKPKAGQ